VKRFTKFTKVYKFSAEETLREEGFKKNE